MLDIGKRRLLAAMGAIALSLPALAQNFPSRPVKIIVPSGPGGPADIMARAVAPGMSKSLGQPVVVENRSGASGTLGVNAVARAESDGYTIGLISESHAGAESLYPKRGYVLTTDFAPVGTIGSIAMMLVVHPSLPVKNVNEFLAYAKAQPNKLTYASGGSGNIYHLAAELLSKDSGVSFSHIPYSAVGAGRTDVMSGQVNFMFDAVASILPNVEAGRLRGLAVTTPNRLPNLPAVPTMGESVPGYVFESWIGLVAPAATPAAVTARLHEALESALRDKDIETRFNALGAQALPESSGKFGERIASGVKKWTEVIQKAGIKAE